MPRDRWEFNPKLIKKREVILNGTDDMIISLYAKGLSVRILKTTLKNYMAMNYQNKPYQTSQTQFMNGLYSTLEVAEEIVLIPPKNLKNMAMLKLLLLVSPIFLIVIVELSALLPVNQMQSLITIIHTKTIVYHTVTSIL